MKLMIALDEKQAGHLQRQASARHISAEQFAGVLLKEALVRIEEEETWGAVNHRRLDLIGKSRSTGLSAEEEKELNQLQGAVDGRLEPMDRRLLAAAQEFRKLAEGLPDGYTE